MIKVITYGTFDLLHEGHIKLLERAKELGDYLIVGVTADDFDKSRGKINVQQSLMERVEAVRNTGIADEIIIEEHEGQKIEDIRKMKIDVFTVGSDWIGKFDYLNQYCKVVYLERTKGISSSELRSENSSIKLGLVGNSKYLDKVYREAKYINGLKIIGVFCDTKDCRWTELMTVQKFESYEALLEASDAVYIHSIPSRHFKMVKFALELKKHVMCESPIALNKQQCEELYRIAKEKKCVLIDTLRTAYATAYCRLVLMVKAGRIGEVKAIDATCTSLTENVCSDLGELEEKWNSITAWGPTAMLPIFQILGTNFLRCQMVSSILDESIKFDKFTSIIFVYEHAIATVKVGNGVKSEGQLVISGTKGYIYVPAPWWKTEYFEIRYEDPVNNRRFFYKLDGEGIRYQLASFIKTIYSQNECEHISETISKEICDIMERFENGQSLLYI